MRETTQEEYDGIMDSMKKFAEGGVPCFGNIGALHQRDEAFWCQQNGKMLEEAEEDGVPFETYPKLHRQIWAKEYYCAHVKGLETKF